MADPIPPTPFHSPPLCHLNCPGLSESASAEIELSAQHRVKPVSARRKEENIGALCGLRSRLFLTANNSLEHGVRKFLEDNTPRTEHEKDHHGYRKECPRRPVSDLTAHPDRVRLMHKINAVRERTDQREPFCREGPFFEKACDADDCQETAGTGPEVRENIGSWPAVPIRREVIQYESEGQAFAPKEPPFDALRVAEDTIPTTIPNANSGSRDNAFPPRIHAPCACHTLSSR